MIFAFGKDFQVDRLVNDFLLMALDQNENHERNRDKKGTFLHKHGWGVAYLANGRWKLKKSIKPCYENKDFLKLKSIKTPVIMIHARHLSSGTVALENTHPFKEKANSTEYLFCHNGNIGKKDWKKFRVLFDPKGNADSEQLFSHILGGEISKFSTVITGNTAPSNRERTCTKPHYAMGVTMDGKHMIMS